MKNGASLGFLKQVISLVTTMAKAKSLALKNKTRAIKTRLFIFSLLRNKKVLLTSISHKLHALLGQEEARRNQSDDDESRHAIVVSLVCNAMTRESQYPNPTHTAEDKTYPDLTHSLFEESDQELELEDPGGSGSVIEMVRHSKEEGGEEFKLEDEIDHVADLFIRRFHRQMRMQKQQSFKRYQEMLQRSA
ncbi:hypothetical protein L1049_003359 [Liquidambar formosana]|uniref:Uncharacterized protein n=1 Tax=Liquidambar formosana TaxID=63359 RepID=A0AAP0NMA6_LIQFO